jgi:diguanylate cyclase (GGDEF)-like protein
MAERVRRAVSEAEIIEAGQRIPVTVSIGGSGLPDKNINNAQDLILVADAAMYSCKESGRDRCAVA